MKLLPNVRTELDAARRGSIARRLWLSAWLLTGAIGILCGVGCIIGGFFYLSTDGLPMIATGAVLLSVAAFLPALVYKWGIWIARGGKP